MDATEAFASSPTTPLANPATGLRDAPRSLGTTQNCRSGREKDDAYQGVVLPLTESWRLVVCREGRQWIIQHRRSANDWKGRKYLSRAENVPPVVHELIGEQACLRAIEWLESLSHRI